MTRALPALLLAGALAPAQAPALKVRAEAARTDLFVRLSSRLQEVMAAQGPAAAIEVCRTEAPALAEAAGKAHGVRIGRTSWKLRNPANEPPAWARAALEAKPTQSSFEAGPEGGLRALMPIRLAKGCLACHGDPAGFAPEVRQALAQHYPKDQATGFREGDLRGWFWVEVPPEVRP